VTAVEPATERQPQSAAAPSPFPPIAEYAFLSNCHTGALVAPDGAIDWLCVPRFDSPSVFGSLLDREAGFFRFGPFGINHPAAVVYQPGTNVLETTWKTPNGWIVVRDALTMSAREHEDTITPHTRPPADDDADHMLIRTVECIEGQVEVELVCEPAFDYGRAPAEWALVGDDRHAADAVLNEYPGNLVNRHIRAYRNDIGGHYIKGFHRRIVTAVRLNGPARMFNWRASGHGKRFHSFSLGSPVGLEILMLGDMNCWMLDASHDKLAFGQRIALPLLRLAAARLPNRRRNELRRAFPNARIRHDKRCWRGRTVILRRNHRRNHALTGIDDHRWRSLQFGMNPDRGKVGARSAALPRRPRKHRVQKKQQRKQSSADKQEIAPQR
jgi:hypothetical protein